MKNPYNSLGVNKKATPEEIKKAYRKLAMKNHPDRGGNKELFQEMTLAYETLSDEGRRRQYDETGSGEKIASLDDQAVQLIAVIFSQLIDAAEFNGNYVAEVKSQLKHMKAKPERIIATHNKNLNRLVSTLGRVKVDGSDHNIFVSIINQKIEATENGLAIESERMVLLGLSSELILKYSDSKVEVNNNRQFDNLAQFGELFYNRDNKP